MVEKTYAQLLQELQAKLNDPSYALTIHRRWTRIAKGIKSPTWGIGSKYV